MKNNRSQALKVPQSILDIKEYTPGRSTAGNAEGGIRPIKLSSNESAFGASPLVRSLFERYAKGPASEGPASEGPASEGPASEGPASEGDTISKYPDGSCTALRQKLASMHDIEPGYITIGAGSDEILSLIGKAFIYPQSEVIYSQYGFLMYKIIAQQGQARHVIVEEPGFAPSPSSFYSKITPQTSVIFIANPNNPTGFFFTKNEIEELLQNTPPHVLLVLDCAYAEYASHISSDYSSCLHLVSKYPNLVITRTFSKIYGLASLRLGWCYGGQFVTGVINKVRGPFNVSGIAQQAGVEALSDAPFISTSAAYNAQQVQKLTKALKAHKIECLPTAGNFILMLLSSEGQCSALYSHCLAEGIIMRDMLAYGISNGLRLTIGTEEECSAAISSISRFFAKNHAPSAT